MSPAGAPALLGALFQYAPLGLGFWDTDLICRRINPALAAINGRSVEESLGRRMPEVLGPLGEELEAIFQRVLDTGEAQIDLDIEGETLAAPGVARHWRATYYPVFADSPAPVGVAAAVIEVTGERQAMSQAAAATALLDAVVDAAPVGIGFFDLDLRYQRVNQALADLVGVPPEDLIGRLPSDVAGELGGKVEDLLTRARDTRQAVYEHELSGELASRPGEVQHRAGSWFPVFGAAGEVVGLGGVVRDATERHRLDRDRQRLLKDAVTARAHAEAAQVRAESAHAAAEAARRDAEAARIRTEFLAEAGRRMASSMDYERTLQEIAQIVVPGLADWCVVVMRRPSGALETIALAHSDPSKLASAQALSERYPPNPDRPRGVGAVLRSGEAELTAGITDEMLVGAAESDEHLEIMRDLDMRTVLIVPLHTPVGVIGTLSLVLTGMERTFAPEDVSMAQSLADRAALHIRNAQLYTERSHIARTLQASLLPRALPDIPGMQIAARYLAAGDANEVGGDFYDAFPSDAGEWTAMIGDVVGKGPEAAALTSLTRHTLRTAAMHAQAPAENLRTLNRALISEVGDSRFCTVVYARIRPDAGGAAIRLATGGHPPPRIVRADGTLEIVAVRGSLVGWMADPQFGETDVRLGPGDLMVLFTDGVIEVRGRGAEYGERELDETLRGLAGIGADDAAQAILDRAVATHGGTAPDDIALLVLRVGT